MEDDGRAGAAEVLAGEIAAFPDFFAGFAIKSCRSVAAKVNVDVVGIDGGRAGTVAVDVVAERFGIGVLEEKEVVNFLPVVLSRQTAYIFFPSGVALVTQTSLSMTTGVDQARPVTGVFQTMFLVSLHSVGKPWSLPSPRGG